MGQSMSDNMNLNGEKNQQTQGLPRTIPQGMCHNLLHMLVFNQYNFEACLFLWIINMSKNPNKIYIIKILKLWGAAIKNGSQWQEDICLRLRYLKIPVLWKIDNNGISQELGAFSWTIDKHKADTAPNYCQIRELKSNSNIHLITMPNRVDFSARLGL